MGAAELIREARKRHGLDQRALARRAGTSQGQISKIERGVVSPSVSTLERLLGVMGERLELQSVPGPRPNQSTRELRRDYEEFSVEERVAQAAALSEALATIAAGEEDALMKNAAGRDSDHVDIRALEEARGATD